MSHRALGIYREPEFSPGKVEADAAILDAVLAELKHEGVAIQAIDASSFAAGPAIRADMVLPMCQGPHALKRLAEVEQAGAVAINSALSIRNCYRDLLAAGLERAGVPTPPGVLIATDTPIDLRRPTVDLAAGVFVKRGDLHALAPEDVQHASNRSEVESILADFARRGIRFAYIQQEVVGRVVKFYGVGGGLHFSVHPEDEEVPEAAVMALSACASSAAATLGLEAWGGDAVLSGDRFAIIDFNDWPSFSRVRGPAARAIARRAINLLGRSR